MHGWIECHRMGEEAVCQDRHRSGIFSFEGNVHGSVCSAPKLGVGTSCPPLATVAACEPIPASFINEELASSLRIYLS